MLSLYKDSELYDLLEKVNHGVQLDYDDGVRLFKSNDILTIGYLANNIRRTKHGQRVIVSPYRRQDSAFYPTEWSDSREQPVTFVAGNPAIVGMAYGVLQSAEARIDYILRIRELQDRSSSIQAFFPFSYPLDHEDEPQNETTGFDDLKVIAIARILLDNVDNIVASVTHLGPRLAQVALDFGADVLTADQSEISSRRLFYLVEKAAKQPVEKQRFKYSATH